MKVDVKIKLEIKNGIEVELTKDEAKELIDILKVAIDTVVVKEIEYVPYRYPFKPIYPIYPSYPNWIVTYSNTGGYIQVNHSVMGENTNE